MSKIRFKIKKSGVRELLKSEGIAKECEKYATEIYTKASSAADGYTMSIRNYKERTGYAVYAEDYPAIADNLKNNTLLKSLK